MLRWRGLGDLPGSWGRCVVTIGVFEGPKWPVDGGDKAAKPVFSTALSLADVGG